MAGDFLRVYLGLAGSGKTTRALMDFKNRSSVVVYSPGASNPLINGLPWIFDSPGYLKDWRRYLEKFPQLRIEKKAYPSTMFRHLASLRGYSILLDDVAALKTEREERADFEAFLRTVRFNGNQVIITTHRARKDISPLVHTLATSVYYVGPGVRSKREIETLYELSNYPISLENFTGGLATNKPFQLFKIRGVQ